MKDWVLCLIEKIPRNIYFNSLDEQVLWMDLIDDTNYKPKEIIIPLYNHAHSDKENGQPEIHYHINTKYQAINRQFLKDITLSRIALPLKSNQKLEYRLCTKISDIEFLPTSVEAIKKSKLKRKCIHNGKCPHRGFDLSNEKPDENGVITCPLHGLRFKSKKLIEQ